MTTTYLTTGWEPDLADADSICLRWLRHWSAQLAAFAERTFVEAFAKDNRPDDMRAYLAGAYGLPQQARELADPQVVTDRACTGEDLTRVASGG